jgi:hypothetical protein
MRTTERPSPDINAGAIPYKTKDNGRVNLARARHLASAKASLKQSHAYRQSRFFRRERNDCAAHFFCSQAALSI